MWRLNLVSVDSGVNKIIQNIGNLTSIGKVKCVNVTELDISSGTSIKVK